MSQFKFSLCSDVFSNKLYLHHESLLVKQLLLNVMLLHQMLVLLLSYHLLLLLTLNVFRNTLAITKQNHFFTFFKALSLVPMSLLWPL